MIDSAFSSLLQDAYWFMFLQVIVTMLIFPAFAFMRFSRIANAYCQAYYPSAKTDVERYKARCSRYIFSTASLCFLAGIAIVGRAFFTSSELFNWDNQAGMIVLFLIAMVPVAVITFVQKGVFTLLKQHAGSKRSASLRVQNWQDFFSKPLILLLIGGQFIFVGTIMYFVNHPFEGFAGYSNLFGLVILNAVFAASSYVIFHSKKLSAVQAPEQRFAIKVRAVRVNLIIWLVAIYYLSLSTWIAGLQIEGLKLLTQSFYFQLIIFLTAYTLSLPKPLEDSKQELAM